MESRNLADTGRKEDDCLAIEQNQLILLPLDRQLQAYLFPFQFTIGIGGNLINLTILLASGSPNKPQILLACLALSDILFFLSVLPTSVAAYSTFNDWNTYRQFYANTRIHFLAFTNWFSASSIWFVTAVTIERLIAIKYPLKVHLMEKRRLSLVIIFIFVASLTLTFFQHFQYVPNVEYFCNGTQTRVTFVPNVVMMSEKGFVMYAHLSTVLSSGLVVVGPLIALTAMNSILITSLRHQKATMETLRRKDRYYRIRDSSCKDEMKAERRVGIMVAAIILSFSITNTPSVLIFFWHSLNQLTSSYIQQNSLATISNSLVVTNKVLNFFLYCTASSAFRRKCGSLMSQRWRKSINGTSDRLRTSRTSLMTFILPIYSTINNGKPRRHSALDVDQNVDQNLLTVTHTKVHFQRSRSFSEGETRRKRTNGNPAEQAQDLV